MIIRLLTQTKTADVSVNINPEISEEFSQSFKISGASEKRVGGSAGTQVAFSELRLIPCSQNQISRECTIAFCISLTQGDAKIEPSSLLLKVQVVDDTTQNAQENELKKSKNRLRKKADSLSADIAVRGIVFVAPVY